MTFKDYFSDASNAYSQYRPGYPRELFSYLSSLTQSNERAWDCATGSGQSALLLSEYFTEVIATDASKNQIDNAIKKEGITYRVAKAEDTPIESHSVDLITVAQALHWFNINEFSIEAARVLKNNGVLAVWTYGLFDVNPDLNEIVNQLYGSTLDAYWPPERTMVEQGYKNVAFPFHEIEPPSLQMKSEWDLSQLVGYLCTWSAVKQYEKQKGLNPVKELHETISRLWGEPEQQKVGTMAT